jgi:MFS family permease
MGKTVQAVIEGYRRVEPHIRYAIAAQFCVQLVNTAYFLLLNYYMDAEGYQDYAIADILSYRFLAVFWLAFPLGLFIKGRRLKPFFLISTILLPVASHVMLLAIAQHWTLTLNVATMIWGLAYMCMQITILPYILLNAKPETHSEAFSLSFLSFSGTICFTGVINFLLQQIDPALFDERTMLQIVATLAFLGIFFVSRIPNREQLSQKVPLRKITRDYDWGTILRAIIPTLIIAIGAGFTIPVISLFFLNVHGVDSGTFSVMGSITYGMVVCVMLFMPYIKRSFGYRVAITLFQSLAVLALFLLATTEYYKDWVYAVPLATFFYILRQPLMNAAGPMTSELIMYYVGKRNQEIISALNASIWSGSWFISMKLFGLMRQLEYRYVTIFLITVAMYAIGVIWYATIIRTYERRQAAERTRKARERRKREVLV